MIDRRQKVRERAVRELFLQTGERRPSLVLVAAGEDHAAVQREQPADRLVAQSAVRPRNDGDPPRKVGEGAAKSEITQFRFLVPHQGFKTKVISTGL